MGVAHILLCTRKSGGEWVKYYLTNIALCRVCFIDRISFLCPTKNRNQMLSFKQIVKEAAREWVEQFIIQMDEGGTKLR